MAEDQKTQATDPTGADIQTGQSPETPSKPRPWSWALRLASVLLALVLILIALAAFLISTASGLRWGVALAERLLPLHVVQVEGRLSDRLYVADLTLNLPHLGLHLQSLELAWQPRAVLDGRLVVTRLAVQGLAIRLPPASQKDRPLSLPAVLLPLRIEVGEITLQGLQLQRTGQPEPLFVLRSAHLQDGRLADGVLQVGRLEGDLDHPGLHLELAGRANLTGDYPLAVDLAWYLNPAAGAAIAGSGRVEGDLRHLRLAQTLSGAVLAQVEAELEDLLADPKWDARLQVAQVETPDLPKLDLQADLASTGRLHDAQVTGQAQLKAPLEPDPVLLAAQFEVRWQGKRLLIQYLACTLPEVEARLGVRGELDLGQPMPRFILEGDWQGLRWPVTGAPEVRSNAGTFAAQGDLQSFTYRLAGQAAGRGLMDVAVELAGQGGAHDTRIDTLVIHALDGKLEGQGHVGWSPELDWTFDLRAIEVNPGTWFADWPGRLSGRLNTEGGLQHWTLAIQEVQGELRGYPLAADAELAMQDGHDLSIQGLRLTSGPSRLSLSGRIAQSLDLALNLDAPEIASLWPGAAGQLTLDARMSGDRRSPSVRLELKGEGMRLGEQALARLEGQAELDLGGRGRAALQLKGRDLRVGGLAWSAFELTSSGSLLDHRLQAQLKGAPLALNLQAQGSLADSGRYAGQVTRLDLEGKDLGCWSLQRPVKLSRDGERLAAAPWCLRETKGSGGCLGFEKSAPGRWGLEFDLDRLDAGLVKGSLPDGLEAEGAIRLKGRLQAEGPLLSGEVRAEMARGRLRFKLGGDQIETLELADGRLDMTANRAGLEARLALPLGRLGRIQGELGLPGWRLDQSASSLRGRLSAELLDLKPLAALLPEISDLRGAFRSDLVLSGTLAQPVVSVQAQLRDLRFQVPMLALRVEDLDLAVGASANSQLAIYGQARLGGGTLELSGQGQILADRPWVRLGLSGGRIKLVNTREYTVYVEPQLELGLDQEGARVSGEIRIPEARLRPHTLPPGTVSPSRDVTLVSEQAGQSFPLRLDLRLVLGDEVSMDGFGLRGRLVGDLHLSQTPGREPLGDGQLQIIDGQYRLSSGFGIAAELGAPLHITQGRLVFAKSPLNNPGLWLQAERQGGDLTAGVRVVGTLRQPKLTFFSETDPGLTQADITKYLMTGIPPTANDRAQAGLAVGTYIAPRVYMEYESGLGGDSNRLKLRYDLSKHIELQAETGAKQGADLFFKFEH
ncbi:translocation/assembly module TamB [Caldichromatium japonicum]|uniref:Translocation/assembly module TamB n=1 Tax=Caldichromatium japonicum TaxID=2699430 RepID=A0A6G7VAH8_9GAMM|nr:translocation/assembly module TamB domain-containing protein [Caldichromatium japonicum]QIK36875.1 translocation/assembly module TamB [Caldichromatium japonicum]